jgi:hypothetical protein
MGADNRDDSRILAKGKNEQRTGPNACRLAGLLSLWVLYSHCKRGIAQHKLAGRRVR